MSDEISSTETMKIAETIIKKHADEFLILGEEKFSKLCTSLQKDIAVALVEAWQKGAIYGTDKMMETVKSMEER